MKAQALAAIGAFQAVCMAEQLLTTAQDNLEKAIAAIPDASEVTEFRAATEAIRRTFNGEPRTKETLCGRVRPDSSPAVASVIAEFCGFGNAPICLLARGHEGTHVDALGGTWEEETDRVETRTCNARYHPSLQVHCTRPFGHVGDHASGGHLWKKETKGHG
jgi:hypothetical protein